MKESCYEEPLSGTESRASNKRPHDTSDSESSSPDDIVISRKPAVSRNKYSVGEFYCEDIINNPTRKTALTGKSAIKKKMTLPRELQACDQQISKTRKNVFTMKSSRSFVIPKTIHSSKGKHISSQDTVSPTSNCLNDIDISQQRHCGEHSPDRSSKDDCCQENILSTERELSPSPKERTVFEQDITTTSKMVQRYPSAPFSSLYKEGSASEYNPMNKVPLSRRNRLPPVKQSSSKRKSVNLESNICFLPGSTETDLFKSYIHDTYADSALDRINNGDSRHLEKVIGQREPLSTILQKQFQKMDVSEKHNCETQTDDLIPGFDMSHAPPPKPITNSWFMVDKATNTSCTDIETRSSCQNSKRIRGKGIEFNYFGSSADKKHKRRNRKKSQDSDLNESKSLSDISEREHNMAHLRYKKGCFAMLFKCCF